MTITHVLRQQWWVIAYAGVLAYALSWPELGRHDGILQLDRYTQLCIAGVFLCAGLTLPSARLCEAARVWQPHLVIQVTSFVIAPLLAVGIAWIASYFGLPPAAAIGLIVLGCLPTTIGSCVAFTAMSGGNQAITLINSVIGNLLGVVATPLLILLCLGREGSTPVLAVIERLVLIAVVPALMGQILRLRWANVFDASKPYLSVVSGCLLLVVVLAIFSDLGHAGLTTGLTSIACAVIVLHVALLLVAWSLAPLASRMREDRVAILITANQKTGAIGIPLIYVMFAGDPTLPLIVLPVAAYHVLQQLTGGALAPVLKQWAQREPKTKG